MTQEEKAKAYDQAIINGSRLWECGLISRESYETIFPELRESEDERIRQTLIHIVKGACGKYGIKYQGTEIGEERLLSWLEKHSEKKDSDVDGQIHDMTYNPIEKVEQKPAERSEADDIMRIYALEIIGKYWNSLPDTDYDGNEIAESCYNWLKSLKPQPKQEWGEEDESYLNTTIAYLKDAKEFKKTAENCINWLNKSIRPQPHWNPSEEQKPVDKAYTFKAIPRLLDMIQGNDSAISYCQKLIDSLEQEGYSTDAKIVRGCLKRMNGEKIAMATMDEQQPTDNIEPKLKIEKDKWYICIKDLDDNYGTRAFCKGCTYHSTKNDTLIPDNSNVPFEIKYYVNDYFRLWTIQDARGGDVLVNKHGCPLIFKDRETCWCYYSIPCKVFRPNNNRWFFSSEDYLYPANKEQRGLLFAMMKEAGYEWDAENKELKKFEEKPEEWSKRQVVNAITSMLSERLNPLIKKSSDGTISHREEMFMDALIEMRSFVNSPSFKIGKDVSDEWNDEDEMAINAIIQLMKDAERNNGWESTYIDDGNVEVKFEHIASWLKSLRQKPHWKPLEEQMCYLKSAYESYDFCDGERAALEALYNDLQKLL